MTLLLIVLLVLLLAGGGWGYRSGTITTWSDPLGLILFVILIVVLFGLLGGHRYLTY